MAACSEDTAAGDMAPLSRPLLLLLATGALGAARSVVLAVPSPQPVRVPLAVDAEDGDDSSFEADSTAARPVAILEHRQELQDDGTFNYAFSADNGLSQNEAFHPDGSRTGSYSYVDPKGETILVKYRADRFGFHVLDGSSIPSTMQHLAAASSHAPSEPLASVEASDYGEHGVREQGVLNPSYFNYPDSGISSGPAYSAGLTAASSKQTGTAARAGKAAKATRAGKAGKAGKVGKVVRAGAAGKTDAYSASPGLAGLAGGRARSSATSMHFLQRAAREAYVSDFDDDDVMAIDGEETRVTMRKARPPARVTAASSNQVDVDASAVEDIGHGIPARDDGSYQRHAAKYDDGSYERHAGNYDDGSYEPHAAKYDDGSYERHARLYNDGSYHHGGALGQAHQQSQEDEGDDFP